MSVFLSAEIECEVIGILVRHGRPKEIESLCWDVVHSCTETGNEIEQLEIIKKLRAAASELDLRAAGFELDNSTRSAQSGQTLVAYLHRIAPKFTAAIGIEQLVEDSREELAEAGDDGEAIARIRARYRRTIPLAFAKGLIFRGMAGAGILSTLDWLWLLF